jgi:copper chaperone CopZ
MQRQYKISGMTCTGCAQIVNNSLSKVPGVKKVNVDLSKAQAVIEMGNDIPMETLQTALAETLYQISETVPDSKEENQPLSAKEAQVKNKALVSDYITAVGQKDYEQLLKFLHSDFTFDGGITVHSAQDFIDMLKEHSAANDVVVLKNDIQALFVDGNEACVIYEMVTNKPVEPVSVVEWITIEEEKILSTQLKFDRLSMRQLMDEVRKEKAHQ